MPIAYEYVEFSDYKGGTLWAHGIKRPELCLPNKLIVGDVYVYDLEGSPVLTIKGLTAKRVENVRSLEQHELNDIKTYFTLSPQSPRSAFLF